jgi:hypothetical protein
VFFKSSDGSFSGVAAVAVGSNQLVIHVIGCEKVFQTSRCFVVESLKFWFETFGIEFLMNVIICIDPFRGRPGFRWDNLDIIAVINITDHDVRVALAGSHRKYPRPDVLASLIHVPHFRGRREIQIYIDCFLCSAGPSYEIPVFDLL